MSRHTEPKLFLLVVLLLLLVVGCTAPVAVTEDASTEEPEATRQDVRESRVSGAILDGLRNHCSRNRDVGVVHRDIGLF